MNIEELQRHSEARLVKIVFNNTVNDHNTLFGGITLKWMDEVAFITASRFCRKKVVTTSVNNIKFKKSIPHGVIIKEVIFSFAATDVNNKPVKLITDTVIAQESNHL